MYIKYWKIKTNSSLYKRIICRCWNWEGVLKHVSATTEMGCQESKGIGMFVLSLFSLSFLILWCQCWFVLSVGLCSSCHYYAFSSVHSCKQEILNKIKSLLMFPCHLQPRFLWKWGPGEPAVCFSLFPTTFGKVVCGTVLPVTEALRGLGAQPVWSSTPDQPGGTLETAAAPPPAALGHLVSAQTSWQEPSERFGR